MPLGLEVDDRKLEKQFRSPKLFLCLSVAFLFTSLDLLVIGRDPLRFDIQRDSMSLNGNGFVNGREEQLWNRPWIGCA